MKSVAVALALALPAVSLVPATAHAGSWPIRCELAKEKLTLAVEHYNPNKKGTEYDATPMDVELWSGPDGTPVKFKTKKRVGSVWVYGFPDLTVVYTGVDSHETEKHAVFLKADGTWIGETVCK